MRTSFRKFIVLFVAAVTAAATVTKADTTAQATLLQLVTMRFGKLSLAEDRLVNAAVSGEPADCTGLSGDDKNIRGDLLSWLCTNPSALAELTYRGISIAGAEFVGKVNLEWAKISFPIGAILCVFDDPIILSRSQIAFLSLYGSSVTRLEAESTRFEGNVVLRNGFKAKQGVYLLV